MTRWSADAPGAPGRLRAPAAPRAPTVEPDVTEPVTDEPAGAREPSPDVPWVVIVWNDPVNLMSYVVFVLQKLFGYSRERATKLMLDVHHKGRAAVSEGTREKAEADVARLHAHGLWATLEKSGGGSGS